MKLLDLFFAARPMLMLPLWSVYLVGLQYHNRITGEPFDTTDIAVLLSLSLMAAGAAYLNQIHDHDTDRINRKIGFLQRGYLSERALLTASVVTSLVGLAAAALVSGQILMIAGALFLLSWMYSVPPVRLKDRPVAALAANGLGYGLLVSLAVMPDMNLHNTGRLGWDNPIYFFLTVGAVYAVTTIPDAEGDRRTGKRTLAVALGRRQTLLIAAVQFALAAVTAYLSGYLALLALAIFALVMALGAMLLPSLQAVLAATKVPILLLTLLAGFWYPLYLLFLVVLIMAVRAYYLKRFGIVYPRIA